MSGVKLISIVKRSRRRGRGVAGGGSKSGRGMKGQKARAGYSSKAGFEGGQTPLYMRLPKGKGMKQKFPSQVDKPAAVSVRALNNLVEGVVVDKKMLAEMGLVPRRTKAVKLIGSDKVAVSLTVRVQAATPGAKAAVEKAGGTVELTK